MRDRRRSRGLDGRLLALGLGALVLLGSLCVLDMDHGRPGDHAADLCWVMLAVSTVIVLAAQLALIGRVAPVLVPVPPAFAPATVEPPPRSRPAWRS